MGAWREPGFAGRSTDFAAAADLYEGLGFGGALLMSTDRGANEALLAQIRAYQGPAAFRLAYWVDPAAEGALPAFEACQADVAALKVHPSFLRRPVSDEAFRPFLTRAETLGLPVVVHCGRWRQIAGFEHALRVAEERPTLRLVLSHMGGDEPLLVRETVAAIRERALDNVFLGTESVRQYWVVQEALDRLGPGRLIFGSDYNLNHPAAFLAIVHALDADETEKSAILGGTLNGLVPSALRFDRRSQDP